MGLSTIGVVHEGSFALHRIRFQELIRQADAYRLAQRARSAESPVPASRRLLARLRG